MQSNRRRTRSVSSLVISRLSVGLVAYLTILFLLSVLVFRDWRPFQDGPFSEVAACVPALCAALLMVLPRLFECGSSHEGASQRQDRAAQPHGEPAGVATAEEIAPESSPDREDAAVLR